MTATIDDYSPRIGRKAVLPVWSADGGVGSQVLAALPSFTRIRSSMHLQAARRR